MPMPTREAQRAYQREWIAKRRAAYFTGKTCEICGATDGLVLDHVDRTKKEKTFSHAIWSYSEKRRDAELAQCQILCTPCHREKTNSEIRAIYAAKPPSDHGTDARYGSGCRCDPCRAAHSARMRTPKQREHVRNSIRRRKEREASGG